MKACKSPTVGIALTSVLEKYGKSWNDVIIVASDSAVHVWKMVCEICEGEGMNIIHVKDLPQLIHVAVDKAFCCETAAGVRTTVVKFCALLKYENHLYEMYHGICIANGLSLGAIQKPPSVVPVHWYSFYRCLAVVTEM